MSMKPVCIIQNCEVETAGTIFDYLDARRRPCLIVPTYKTQIYPSLDMIEAVINLGCPISMTSYREHEFLKGVYAFVAQVVRANKPYLGICFGAQMLAHVLGAKVAHNSVKEIGTYRVRLTPEGAKDSLLAGFNETFEVFHWHGDTFTVPFGAQLLVEGGDCRNQAFRKGNLVGLQFHLEADPNEVPLWCDVYSGELEEVGKKKEDIVQRYRQVADTVRQLNFKFLDNFFQLG
jgi:GMP synthase (glutamine-hydrolysing)